MHRCVENPKGIFYSEEYCIYQLDLSSKVPTIRINWCFPISPKLAQSLDTAKAQELDLQNYTHTAIHEYSTDTSIYNLQTMQPRKTNQLDI
jgi:hypothetical protein